MRACGQRGDRVAAALTLGAVTLTELVVVLAVHRLSLYEDAYGLTLLRLTATAGALWIGLVFLLIGLTVTGFGARRSWLPGAVVVMSLVGLLAWNLADPAALVARRNVERARVDPAYLAALGDDAVPAITSRLDGLDPAARAELTRPICARQPARRGLLGWNLGAARAADARSALGC